MRGWIRLGLVVTALWVATSAVTIIYLGDTPTWQQLRQAKADDWYSNKVEAGTGRSVVEWNRQMSSALDVCRDAQARKVEAERRPELCDFSIRYAEPTFIETVGINLRAIVQLFANWVSAFLVPIAMWSFFVPFALWFIGAASILFFLRMRGDRPQAPERNRIIH